MTDFDWKIVYRFLSGWDFVTAKDASEWLNIPHRKVLFYIERNLVRPHNPSPGTGNSRKFTLLDFVVFAVFDKLDRLGVKPRLLETVAKDINAIVRDPSHDGKLHFLLCIKEGDETNSLYACEWRNLEDFGSGALLINLAQIQMDVLTAFVNRAPDNKQANDFLRALGLMSKGEALEKAMLEVLGRTSANS